MMQGILRAVVLLSVVVWGQAAWAAAFTHIDYPAAQQAVIDQLPCKWISSKESYDGLWAVQRHYFTFSCTGGEWGTLTLFLDKNEDDGLERVRLLWKNWDREIHPSAGDLEAARQFLAFITYQFIPQRFVNEVQTSFWDGQEGEWKGRYITSRVGVKSYDREGYRLYRPEVEANRDVPKIMPPVMEVVAPTPAPVMASSKREEDITTAPLWQPLSQEDVVRKSVISPAESKKQQLSALEEGRKMPLKVPPPSKPAPAVEYSMKKERISPQSVSVQPGRAKIAVMSDGVRVTGVSLGGRETNVWSFPGQEKVVDEFYRPDASQVWDKVYRQSEDLTSTYTKEAEENTGGNDEDSGKMPEGGFNAIPAARPYREDAPEEKKYEDMDQSL